MDNGDNLEVRADGHVASRKHPSALQSRLLGLSIWHDPTADKNFNRNVNDSASSAAFLSQICPLPSGKTVSLKYTYDLPCEFEVSFSDEIVRFHQGNLEDWISHTKSHFIERIPATSICILCDDSPSREERMLHIGSHHQNGARINAKTSGASDYLGPHLKNDLQTSLGLDDKLFLYHGELVGRIRDLAGGDSESGGGIAKFRFSRKESGFKRCRQSREFYRWKTLYWMDNGPIISPSALGMLNLTSGMVLSGTFLWLTRGTNNEHTEGMKWIITKATEYIPQPLQHRLDVSEWAIFAIFATSAVIFRSTTFVWAANRNQRPATKALACLVATIGFITWIITGFSAEEIVLAGLSLSISVGILASCLMGNKPGKGEETHDDKSALILEV